MPFPLKLKKSCWKQLFHYLGQKYDRKTKIEKFHAFFHPVQAIQDFTSLCTYMKSSLSGNSILLKFFTIKLCMWFLNINFELKICSFEVFHVNLAQKSRQWKGGQICKICNICLPPILSIFELHQQNVPQKNRFLM